MEVILLERIKTLGFMGDVVKVKPGYARNFLLPQKKALRATKENLAVFETRKVHLEAENLKKKTDAEHIAAKIANVSLILIRNAGDTGQLYGSVSAKDIVDSLNEEKGVLISTKQVHIQNPIKAVGIHTVMVSLHPEVEVPVELNIAMSAEEATKQSQGIDVMTEKRRLKDLEAAESAAAFGSAASDEDEA